MSRIDKPRDISVLTQLIRDRHKASMYPVDQTVRTIDPVG